MPTNDEEDEHLLPLATDKDFGFCARAYSIEIGKHLYYIQTQFTDSSPHENI